VGECGFGVGKIDLRYHVGIVLPALRACLIFVFDAENGQIWVLAKPFLSFVAALRGEKMAKPGSNDGHLQAKG
jgi:hypothetical protein